MIMNISAKGAKARDLVGVEVSESVGRHTFVPVAWENRFDL